MMTSSSQELDLIRGASRHLLETEDAEHVPVALVDLGWPDFFELQPAEAVTIVAEEHGRLRAASPALDMAMQLGAGLHPPDGAAIVLPPIGRATQRSTIEAGGLLHVDGLLLAGREKAESLLVLTDRGILSIPSAQLERVPLLGADPELQLTRVTGQLPMTSAPVAASPEAATAAIDLGRRWLASELVGLAESMLLGAASHVSARHQFGRPLATFQAVKHRLAEVHVAIASARAGITTAWADGSPLSAMSAKCLAGLAHDAASAQCHQVQGGIAFTVEHGFHRWIQRGHLLDGLLGRRRDLTRAIGEALVSARRLPRTPQLSDLTQG